MSNIALHKIKNLLRKRIGLHSDTVGESSIERAINFRMNHLGIPSASNYFCLINGDEKEFGELVEEVVVPETWFFRNISPFFALREYVSGMVCLDDKKRKNNPVKILSIPCSTGEEPYSIAMALHEEGLGKGDFYIDAVDISKRALTKAKRAIYGKHSFREPELGMQDKFFKKNRSGFHLSSDIKGYVSFRIANIVNEEISPYPEYYDIIFCRNLLIYFSRDMQKNILDKVYAMLKVGGVLFVGHAETSQINKNYFSKIEFDKSFAYCKGETPDSDGNDSRKSSRKGDGSASKLTNIYDLMAEVTKKDVLLSSRKNVDVRNKKYSNRRVVNYYSVWPKVESLIGAGGFTQATTVCEDLLKDEPDNADGYYYLGLISYLCGSPGGAESLLKKAIYLSPYHQKALGLSKQIAEEKGDDENADYYRRREQKARDKNES